MSSWAGRQTTTRIRETSPGRATSARTAPPQPGRDPHPDEDPRPGEDPRPDEDPRPGEDPRPHDDPRPGQRLPELLAAFEHGGAWDAAGPSAALAVALEAAAGPLGLYDGAETGSLVGIARQWTAIESWAAAKAMAALRAMMREDGEGRPMLRRRQNLPEGWSDSLNYEIAAALAMGPQSAGSLAQLAWALGMRLPGIGRLLADGTLTKSKARVIAQTFEPLDEREATRAEALLLRDLPGKTWFQVRRLAWRAAVTVAPDYAERRRKTAERTQARVTVFREESGTAGLSGRDLPPTPALSAHANVVARAAKYRASGAFPGQTASALEALAYLHLLSGVSVEEAIAYARAATAEPPDTAGPGPDADEDADEDEDPFGEAPFGANDADDPFGGEDPSCDPGDPLGGAGDDRLPGHSDDDRDDDDRDDDDRDDGDDDDGDDDDGADGNGEGTDDEGGGPGDGSGPAAGHPGDGPDSDDDGPDGDDSGPGDGYPDGGGRHCDSDDEPGGDDDPGDGGPAGDGGRPGDGGLEPDGGDGDGGDGGSGGPTVLSEVTAPLATLQGLAGLPGENRLLGPLDPALTRDLAVAAAWSPYARWEVTIVDDRGYAIGHGTARPRRRRPHEPQPRRQQPQPQQPGPAWCSLPARINITVTQTYLSQLAAQAAQPRPGAPPGDWQLVPRAPRTLGDADGAWALTLPGGRELTVRFDVVPTYECDHRYQVGSYQPSQRLRRLVQIRDHECTFPPCSRPASQADFEHAIPYHKGGKTDACNAGARSRRCHQVKQMPGWQVTQPRPGWHVWKTPTGRTYVQEPWRYTA